MGNSAEGHELVFEWMMENYEAITGCMPPEFAAFMPYFASGCSAERLAAAEAFFAEPEHATDGTVKNLRKVSDSVMDCANLREREGDNVATYLNRLVAGP